MCNIDWNYGAGRLRAINGGCGVLVQSSDTPRPASISAAVRVPWWSRQGPGHARRHGKDLYTLGCARRGVSHIPHPVTLYTFVYGVPSARASLAPSASRHYPSSQNETWRAASTSLKEDSDARKPPLGHDGVSVYTSNVWISCSLWDDTRTRNCSCHKDSRIKSV